MGNQPNAQVSHEEEKEVKTEIKSCPVNHEGTCPYKSKHSYNVYGEKMDPHNNMPMIPSQEPQPGQNLDLSKERKQSTIRKGGTEGTWLYPSEQMFYNALIRKNKAQNVQEQDMEYVIRIHNGTNERAWKNVMEWENFQSCPDPTLLKFFGNPQGKSIRGMFYKYILRRDHFDRHDWIIDRCGKEVRYILDFYYHDQNVKLEKEEKNEFYNTKSNIFIDVRPAIFDSFTNFKEYCFGFFKNRKNY